MIFKKIPIVMNEVFHPLIFAVFPVLSLFAHNFDEQTLGSLFIPLVISAVFGLILWTVINFLMKSRKASALLASIILVFIFSYGHVLSFLKSYTPEPLIAKGYLLGIIVFVFLINALLKKRRKGFLKKITIIFNIAAVSVVVMPIFLIGYKEIQRIMQGSPILNNVELNNEGFKVTIQPDIYYIIVERYANEEVLKQIYNFDNSEFTNYLRSKGFYVANSRANYHFTINSLTSSLNMNYLNSLQESIGKDETDQRPFLQYIENNMVIAYLKSRGYKYFHFGFEQGGLTTQNRNADFNFNSNKRSPLNAPNFFGILISQTIYDPLVSLINRLAGQDLIPDIFEGRRIRYYNLTLDQFKNLGDTAKATGPKFVFAHTFILHDPHVFNPDGTYMSLEQAKSLSYQESYVNQIKATNKILKDLIEKLQKDSNIQPVIIVQADEGPYPERIWKNNPQTFQWKKASKNEFKEKFGILNAYYLPDKEITGLYSSITPVNSFRLIFNLYFNENIPLLQDKIYANFDKIRLYDTFEITNIF